MSPWRGVAAKRCGHKNGVITLDLAEADDPHREQLRIEMDEPCPRDGLTY
jgi:hypothetical protein